MSNNLIKKIQSVQNASTQELGIANTLLQSYRNYTGFLFIEGWSSSWRA